MTDYYLDLVNGSDAASGLTAWANAKKSPDEFVGVAAATDVIKVAKTGVLTAVTGTWTVAQATRAYIEGSAAIGVLDVFRGIGGLTVTYYNSAVNQTPASTIVDFRPPYNADRGGMGALNGGAFHVAAPSASTKYAVIDLGSSTDLSAYQEFFFWVGTNGDTTGMTSTSPFTDGDTWRVKLCSDAIGDTVLEEWSLDAPFMTGGSWWAKLSPAGNLPSNVRSVALYTGANTVSNARLGFWGAYAVKSSATVRPGDFLLDTATGFWTRVAAIQDGETTTPKLYALSLPTQEGYFPENRSAISLQSLESPAVTTRSGISTSGTARNDIYDGHDIDGIADDVIWEGGYDTTGDTVDGYTVLDLGMDNEDYGSVFADTGVQSVEFRNFVQSGGFGVGSLPFQSTVHSSALTLTKVDCVHCPGAMTANGTGGVVDDSLFTDCFSFGGQEELSTTSGTLTLNTSVVMNPSTTAWLWEGTVALASCTFIHCDLSVSYTTIGTGFTLQTTGTTRFLGEGSISYENPVAGIATLQDLGPIDIVGHSLSPWKLAPSEYIDTLTFEDQGYATPALVFDHLLDPSAGTDVAGALGGTVLDNWTVNAVSTFELRGYSLKNSTVYLLTGGVLQDAQGRGSIYQACTLGREADSGSFDLKVNSNIRLYDCAVGRPVIYKATQEGYLEMLGGDITGTAHDPIRDSNSVGDLWRMKFHGVSFDSDLTFLNTAGRQFQQRQGWSDNVEGMLSITAIGGAVGANRLHTPNWQAETTNSPVRTAGGKSWKVTTRAALLEDQSLWPVARVAVRAGLLVTAKVFVYVTDECYVYLKAWPGQVGASSAVRVASTNQTSSWEQLSHQFTPTVDGVMEYYLSFSTPVSGRVIHVDDFSFEQV